MAFASSAANTGYHWGGKNTLSIYKNLLKVVDGTRMIEIAERILSLQRNEGDDA